MVTPRQHITPVLSLIIATVCMLGFSPSSQAAVTGTIKHFKLVQTAVGPHHTCAITKSNGPSTGTLVSCWGHNPNGEINAPQAAAAMPGFITQVSAGTNHTCAIGQAIDKNYLFCWGDSPITTGPDGIEVSADKLVSGNGYSCLLQSATNLITQCYSKPNTVLPRVLNPGTNLTELPVEPAVSHGCKNDDLGTVSCWGLDACSAYGAPVVLGGSLKIDTRKIKGALSLVSSLRWETCSTNKSTRLSWELADRIELGEVGGTLFKPLVSDRGHTVRVCQSVGNLAAITKVCSAPVRI